MTAASERLLTALETEITNVSKLEHVLARTRVVLREHATRLRLGEDAEIVMTGLRFNVPAETGLALLERVDPFEEGKAGFGRHVETQPRHHDLRILAEAQARRVLAQHDPGAGQHMFELGNVGDLGLERGEQTLACRCHCRSPFIGLPSKTYPTLWPRYIYSASRLPATDSRITSFRSPPRSNYARTPGS